MIANQAFTLKDKNQMMMDIANIRLHIDVLNNETGELKDLFKELSIKIDKSNSKAEEASLKMEKVKTDMEWLTKTYWIIASASVGALVMATFNLLIK